MLQKQPRLKMAGWEPPPSPAAKQRAEVRALYLAGLQQPEIASRLGLSQARISQIMSPFAPVRSNKRMMLRKMRPPETAIA